MDEIGKINIDDNIFSITVSSFEKGFYRSANKHETFVTNAALCQQMQLFSFTNHHIFEK